MARTSNRVDAAIKECWAKLAREGVKRALCEVRDDKFMAAEGSMRYVEQWLKRAGAEATRQYFTVERP